MAHNKPNVEEKEIQIEEPLIEEKAERVIKLKPGSFNKESWKPKTSLGMKVKTGEVNSLDYILDNRLKILEHEIIDVLMPNLATDLLLVGQAKGKFGGGQKRVFRQTQKKTREGNKPRFGTFAIIGNESGYVGVGYGKSKETVPAREKAIRSAKQNIINILRGCGSWQCGCKNPHSIPFAVEGKCGSVRINLIPAPRGTGLRIQKELAKILKIAGIRDIWSQTFGQTRTTVNMVYACFDALKKIRDVKLQKGEEESLGIAEGHSNAQ